MYFFSLLTKITSFRHISSTEKCVETDYNIYYSDREKVDSLLCVSLLEQKGIMAWHEVTTGGTNDGELFSAPTAQVMLTENARKTIDPWKPGKITYSEAVEHAHTILPINAAPNTPRDVKCVFLGRATEDQEVKYPALYACVWHTKSQKSRSSGLEASVQS